MQTSPLLAYNSTTEYCNSNNCQLVAIMLYGDSAECLGGQRYTLTKFLVDVPNVPFHIGNNALCEVLKS